VSKPVRKALKVRTPSLTSISLKRISKETRLLLSLNIMKEKNIIKEKRRRRIIEFIFIP
jgi:hypothetical protein|tara:strand:+ start:2325 stop:2501 length:177 start_codon:yes stop_codon:yes gene_type:complete